MSTIPNSVDGGSRKTPSSIPAPAISNGPVDWSALLPKEEREAKDAHTTQIVAGFARQEEAKARQEEAKTERARLGTINQPPPQTDQAAIVLEWAMSKNMGDIDLEYLVDPFLPARCVVGFFGRGSTAKSTFLATMAARNSEDWSTLWISVEELKGWIAQRHVRAGGAEGTLAVFSHSVIKRDAQGRVTGSTFDIFRDLNGAILAAAEGARNHYIPPRPLRLVVLDTAVGLTTWGKGESANDDGAVKRLLGFLQFLAEQHDVCIAIIGHSNKGKHDFFADTVAGSSAWTNSPRLSFVHATDRREEHTYVMRVAKTNVCSFFAVAYRTEPVLTLHQHEDGHASVLCKVELEPIVWGGDASMDLFESATRKPEDDNHIGRGKQSLVESALNLLVQLVYASAEPITRDVVHVQLGRELARREWRKIDERLTLAQFQYKVELMKGLQNKALYGKLA